MTKQAEPITVRAPWYGTAQTRPPASAMMHLPGCFLLTRLFQGHPFYRAAWCCSKVFQVSPLPPTYTFTISLLCTAGTLLFFFISVKQGGNNCQLYKAKTAPLSPPCHITGDVVQEKRDEPSHCPRVHDLVLIACEKTPRTWLSTSQMLTGHFPFHSDSFFYCSFTNLRQWRLHYSKMVCILAHSMAVRPLYHSDGLVRSRLVDSKCFLSFLTSNSQLEIKRQSFHRQRYCTLLRRKPFSEDGVR